MLLERCDTEPFTYDTLQVRCYSTKLKLTTSVPLTALVFGKWDVEVLGEMGFGSLRVRQYQCVMFLLICS